ncbi:MAG: type II secretion system F family protein [Kiritimatiellae bacterium]|jgi:type IV pilus assembly protein PilC|nr:type II secretion system F family protein [Kiritimatiellia bacterium]
MPRYRFVAMDGQGNETEGVLDAESQARAVALIKSRGYFPTRVSEIGGGTSAKAKKQKVVSNDQSSKSSFFQKKVRAREMMTFTRQFATLVDAGLPLLRGMRILLKQEKHPALKDALNGMSESIEAGNTFSESLTLYPKIFDNLFINMVKAGEAGGVLETVLLRLAEFMEKAEHIRNKVKGAMIYPVVVLVAAFGIVTFLMSFVIPKFEQIFIDLGVKMPIFTQFIINISGFVKGNLILIFVVIGVLIVGSKIFKKTKKGGEIMDRVAMVMPLTGPLVKKTAIGRFARTLGTLMSSGVPVLQALNIVRDTSGNIAVSEAIQQVHDSVKEGDSMSLPMEASGIFPGMVISMVDVGEETGALPEMLIRIADNYDDEVDNAVEGMTAAIEPILIIFLALIVGGIVIAMFMPMMSIMGGIGG